MYLLASLIIWLWKRPVLSTSVAPADKRPVMEDVPSIPWRLIQIFSTRPFLNSIFGARVALMVFICPLCSTTHSAVCAGTQSLYCAAVIAVMSEARVTCRCTEQRASPKPHVSPGLSAPLIVDLAQVLVRSHLRSFPLALLLISIVHSRRSQSSRTLASPGAGSSATEDVASSRWASTAQNPPTSPLTGLQSVLIISLHPDRPPS